MRRLRRLVHVKRICWTVLVTCLTWAGDSGATVLEGLALTPRGFLVGEWVEVTYRPEPGVTDSASGSIREVGEHSLTIARGAWGKTSRYANMVRVTVKSPRLTIGSRIRVGTSGRWAGRLAVATTDSFRLVHNDGALTLARNKVRSLDVSLGARKQTAIGGVIGAIVGVAGAGVLAFTSESLPMLLMPAIGSTGAGMLIGARVTMEKWERVLPGLLRPEMIGPTGNERHGISGRRLQ